MRRFLPFSILTLCLAWLCPISRAQDADKIINESVKAIGGSRALFKVQTLEIEGTLTRASDGKTGTFTLETKLPNRFYLELTIGERPEILAYNGKSAWEESAKGEIATLLGEGAVEMEAAAEIANGHLLKLKKSRIAAGFEGHVEVRGKDALRVELTTPSGVKRELYFDPGTHLLVREIVSMPAGDEQYDYDDYQRESGIGFAHKIELQRGGESFQISITRVTVNGVIGERVFDFPRKDQVQLPDLKALFKEIDANQEAINKIKENYAGTRDEEETEYDKTGKVTKDEKTEYTFFYLNGDEISTLVKKDGKPLSEEEQKKENEKTRKHIEDIQKEQAKKAAKEEKEKQEGKKDSGDDPGIEDFLRACEFVNPRRERFRGRDVLVFDFEPNPEFKAHNLAEKVAQKLAGVVWVDEQAHQVVRLEAYFLNDFRFAGGLLANLQKGTSFVFEQEYVNNEVWLPTYLEAHVGVRVLLVKGFKVNAVTRYSDYQRFNVKMLNTVGKPKGETETPEKQP
ncbi:MAG TPA: hypothetical protein VLV88_10385 [Terriglobales bacterium]|nr:hypothetical protein [Terriglobales bacterium]